MASVGPSGLRPWLWMPARFAHHISPLFLKLIALRGPNIPAWQSFEWRGLHFANRLGIAGGVDKDAASLPGWWALGAGFIEVGTLTPQPQGPNPGKIIGRDRHRDALWNKMGFPNAGFEVVHRRLQKQRPFQTPVFINIGKNRDTPLERASEDYCAGLRFFYDVADAYVINVSSPNTQGLRSLAGGAALSQLLSDLQNERRDLEQKYNRRIPTLVKLSPDMNRDEMSLALRESVATGIDGFILTNTTTSRDPNCCFPIEGGVSGGPLAEKARNCLRDLIAELGPARQGRLIISVGGVLSGDEVRARLDLGADLVQVYAALIFRGPHFLLQMAREQEKYRSAIQIDQPHIQT